jgi:hypothetical protein
MKGTGTLRTLTPLAAFATAWGVALPALAGGLAEPPAEAPVAVPAPVIGTGTDWTGGWVGGHLGYGGGEAGAADGSAAVYGLGGGYDHDFGQWVVGAALEWSQTDLDLGSAGDTLDDIARLKFRVGADLGRTFVYATAGPASANATVGGLSDSDTGWFGGVGADWLVNDRWTVGGEILTNRFDDFAGSGTDLEATTATLNIGFRF